MFCLVNEGVFFSFFFFIFHFSIFVCVHLFYFSILLVSSVSPNLVVNDLLTFHSRCMFSWGCSSSTRCEIHHKHTVTLIITLNSACCSRDKTSYLLHFCMTIATNSILTISFFILFFVYQPMTVFCICICISVVVNVIYTEAHKQFTWISFAVKRQVLYFGKGVPVCWTKN